MPDDETTNRIYQRATSGRRSFSQRRRLLAAVAVLAAAGIAGGLSLTLGGGGGTSGTGPSGGPHPGGPGGGMALAPWSLSPNVSNGQLTSIDVSLRSVRPDTTLEFKVVHTDASQPTAADSAPSQVVFDQQVTPTVYNSTMQDATHSSWSGTLNPSDWTGGCQAGLYRIEYTFGPDTDSGSTNWFACTGIAGPTGSTGPTGSSTPTG